ncbi:hypothetical protein B296_00031186 [Ensete ventricosum]|uniref:Uncharacterized protein n=1 Tax=Ensete ventricosum TaxID=4639 RepID=A0A426Y8N8_ENSVE|nr:hypothetical protein B296_00031186 [Ensete ventricosum]
MDCSRVRPAKSLLVRAPESGLLPKLRFWRLLRFLRLSGSDPLRELKLRSRTVSQERSPSCEGTDPERLLFAKIRVFRFRRLPSASGTGPERKLDERSKYKRLASAPRDRGRNISGDGVAGEDEHGDTGDAPKGVGDETRDGGIAEDEGGESRGEVSTEPGARSAPSQSGMEPGSAKPVALKDRSWVRFRSPSTMNWGLRWPTRVRRRPEMSSATTRPAALNVTPVQEVQRPARRRQSRARIPSEARRLVNGASY